MVASKPIKLLFIFIGVLGRTISNARVVRADIKPNRTYIFLNILRDYIFYDWWVAITETNSSSSPMSIALL
ncbi:MAG: hypothetical protein ACD_25C00206G0002 [uncultured bacterium]|nr:MAG: hypothetical protein ACD_25C00206G0002 [uncultured bacterium]